MESWKAARIVTGCLHPTSTDNYFIIAGIQPTELSCQKSLLSLARRTQDPEELLHETSMEWRENASRIHTFIKDITPTPPGITFPKPAWVKLNCLRTGVILFRSEKHKWGMAPVSVAQKEQTAEHVITYCPIYNYSNETLAFSDVNMTLVTWLMETCLGI